MCHCEIGSDIRSRIGDHIRSISTKVKKNDFAIQAITITNQSETSQDTPKSTKSSSKSSSDSGGNWLNVLDTWMTRSTSFSGKDLQSRNIEVNELDAKDRESMETSPQSNEGSLLDQRAESIATDTDPPPFFSLMDSADPVASEFENASKSKKKSIFSALQRMRSKSTSDEEHVDTGHPEMSSGLTTRSNMWNRNRQKNRSISLKEISQKHDTLGMGLERAFSDGKLNSSQKSQENLAEMTNSDPKEKQHQIICLFDQQIPDISIKELESAREISLFPSK